MIHSTDWCRASCMAHVSSASMAHHVASTSSSAAAHASSSSTAPTASATTAAAVVAPPSTENTVLSSMERRKQVRMHSAIGSRKRWLLGEVADKKKASTPDVLTPFRPIASPSPPPSTSGTTATAATASTTAASSTNNNNSSVGPPSSSSSPPVHPSAPEYDGYRDAWERLHVYHVFDSILPGEDRAVKFKREMSEHTLLLGVKMEELQSRYFEILAKQATAAVPTEDLLMMNRWMIDDEMRQMQRIAHDTSNEENRQATLAAASSHPPPQLTLPPHLARPSLPSGLPTLSGSLPTTAYTQRYQ